MIVITVKKWNQRIWIGINQHSTGFPGSSAGKESACNAGDLGLIPGSGSSPGEGIGYPVQYSWASLVAQTVENPPAMRETWVWSLGWEDPLEKGKTIHSRILASRMGSQRVGHNWATKHIVVLFLVSSWTFILFFRLAEWIYIPTKSAQCSFGSTS